MCWPAAIPRPTPTSPSIEAVIAHEYFHNWTGNRITCRDWFQLCLKEGLTVFRDQEFSSDMRSRPVKRIADVRGLRAAQFIEDAGPLAHPVRPEVYKEINNFYTATVYEKGAEVVRMVQTLIGEEKFRAGMDLYFERHDGEAATVEQFIQCFADASGRDIFAVHALVQSGRHARSHGQRPLRRRGSIPIRWSAVRWCRRRRGSRSSSRWLFRSPSAWSARTDTIFRLRLRGGGTIERNVLVLREPRTTFEFTGIAERPVPSVNRGFSAPVRLDIDVNSDDLAFLAANDS